jgi:hypothetical protein
MEELKMLSCSSRTVRLFAGPLVASALLLIAPLVAAQQGDVSAAASAFSRAQEAEARGDPGRAASLYELADRISPAPAALRNATRARLAAGQLGAAAVNAEELKRRYPGDADSSTLADEVLNEARQKLGRISAQCSPDCHLVVDGLAASTELKRAHIVYVEPGQHAVVARFESGTSATQNADAKAGQPIQLQLIEPAGPPAPAPPPPAETAPLAPATPPPAMDQRGSGGLSPVVGLAIGGAAVVLGGVAVWSALDTQSAADDFKKNPTREAFDDGEGMDTRTNILIGAAVVVGVASASVLLLATDWSGGKAQSSGGMSLRLVGSPRQTGFNLQGSF